MALANNFSVNLPEGIPDEFIPYLIGFEHDYNNQQITLTFEETPTISIRDYFYNEDNCNKIKGYVLLGYLSVTGQFFKRECFEDVSFLGMSFNALSCFSKENLKTSITLMYSDRKTLTD